MAAAKKTLGSVPKNSLFEDVAQPGTTAPSTSSKPIIVTNRPTLKDPMMVADDTIPDDTAAKSQSAQAAPKPMLKKMNIEPLHDHEVASASEANDASSPEPVSEVISASSIPSTDADTSSAEPTVKSNELAEHEAAERADELTQLIDSRKYYLPINQVASRRNRRYLWLALVAVIILSGIWAEVMLDAGLLTIPGVKPVTHFFK